MTVRADDDPRATAFPLRVPVRFYFRAQALVSKVRLCNKRDEAALKKVLAKAVSDD